MDRSGPKIDVTFEEAFIRYEKIFYQLAVRYRVALGSCGHVCRGYGETSRVFILAGQSNMEGQAVVDLDGKD